MSWSADPGGPDRISMHPDSGRETGGHADDNIILGALLQDCGMSAPGQYAIHFSRQPNASSATGNRVKAVEVRDPQHRLQANWADEPGGDDQP